jgi:hypothetical protein
MSNPVRTCIGCAQSDDHPRHVIATGDGAAVTWHMDCHAIASDCDICKAQLADVGGVKKNPKGDALRAHLVTTGPEADKPGWTAPADEPVATSDEQKG